MKHRKLAFSITALLLGVSTAFAADRDVTLVVEGMACAAESIMVRKSLERITGVKVVRVDVDASTMHLMVSDDAVSDTDLVKAAANAGYQSQVGSKSVESK